MTSIALRIYRRLIISLFGFDWLAQKGRVEPISAKAYVYHSKTLTPRLVRDLFSSSRNVILVNE